MNANRLRCLRSTLQPLCFPLWLVPVLFAACEPGRVSTCTFAEQPECHATEPPRDQGSSENLDAATPPAPPAWPIRRTFREVTRVFLDPKRQFAGIYQNEAIVRQENNSLLRYARRPDVSGVVYNPAYINLGISISYDFDSPYDKIYVTKSSAYSVQYDPDMTRAYSSKGDVLWRAQTSERGPAVRAFFDSQTNSIAVSAHNAGTTNFNIRLSSVEFSHKVERRIISSHVIGDLDKYENTKNGLEYISLATDGVNVVRHELSDSKGQVFDPELAKALEMALTRPAAGLSIQSAYILDFNNDNYMDFLYTIGGMLQSVTYLGRKNTSNSPTFFVWPSDSFPRLMASEALSIHPINIDGDQFPDLLIETKDHLIYLINEAAH